MKCPSFCTRIIFYIFILILVRVDLVVVLGTKQLTRYVHTRSTYQVHVFCALSFSFQCTRDEQFYDRNNTTHAFAYKLSPRLRPPRHSIYLTETTTTPVTGT